MRINEIFDSLSGEVDGFGGQGKPTTFIRLQGCNLPLGCSYCDSSPAFFREGGTEMSIDEILERINMPKVIITGGEPLVQSVDVKELTKRLLDTGLRTTIETNGSILVPHDFPHFNSSLAWQHHEERKLRLRIVMDYKLPSSKMEQHMDIQAFELLEARDVIKFVIGDDVDYARMKKVLADNSWIAQIAISPALSILPGKPPWSCYRSHELAQKVIDDPDLKHACFSLQIHKLLEIR